MARLPIYQRQTDAGFGVGQRLPRVEADAFGAGLGTAMQQAGGRLLAVAEERDRAADNAALTDAIKAMEELEVAHLEARSAARSQAPEDGDGYADALLKQFDARRAALEAATTNRRARQWLEPAMARLRGRIELEERGYAEGLRAGKVVADYAAARNLAANTLFSAPNLSRLEETRAAHGALVEALDVPAEVKRKLLVENDRLFGRQFGLGLAERDPYRLRELIEAGTLNALLDPADMAAMANRADAEIKRIETERRMLAAQARAEARAAQAEARRAQADAVRAAREEVRDVLDYARNGGVLSPQEWKQVAGAAAQLGMAGAAREAQAFMAETEVLTRLRGANAREVAALRADLDRRYAEAGGKVDGALLVQRRAVAQFEAAMATGLRQDPLAWANRQGVARIEPLDPANGATWQARGRAAREVATRYGTPLTVLTADEQAAFGEVLANGTPAQRQALLQAIAQMGPTGARAAMRQLARDVPAVAHAGALATLPGGAPQAATILRGVDALKANPRLAPREDADVETMRVVGPALARLPALADVVGEAARAHFAGAGPRDGFDRRAFQRSIDTVLGGRVGADGVKRGGLGRRNGVAVLLPDGMSQQEFDQALDGFTLAQTPADRRPVFAGGQEATEADLRRLKPFAVGDGRYVLATDAAGRELLMRRNGEPFMLKVGR